MSSLAADAKFKNSLFETVLHKIIFALHYIKIFDEFLAQIRCHQLLTKRPTL